MMTDAALAADPEQTRKPTLTQNSNPTPDAPEDENLIDR
jgi:hypothetical protein